MEKHTPMRMCIACREMYPQNTMLRFVRDNNSGEVLTDFRKKLFGRGAYICNSRECMELALKKKALSRHFKCAVSEELYRITEDWI